MNELKESLFDYAPKTHIGLQRVNHETFNVPILTLDDTIDIDRRKLRLELAFEELSELASAFGCEEVFSDICSKYVNVGKRFNTYELDKVGVLDALCDIDVINNGTILESGVSKHYELAYLETHKNNMNKAHGLLCDAEKTVKYYEEEKGLSGLTIKENNGKYIVYRSDGKYLKPYNHKSNDLTSYTVDKLDLNNLKLDSYF